MQCGSAADQRNMQLVDCTLSPRLPPTLWSLLSVFSPYSVIKTIQQLFCFCSYLMISRPWKEWPVQLLQVNLRSASVAVQQCLYEWLYINAVCIIGLICLLVNLYGIVVWVVVEHRWLQYFMKEILMTKGYIERPKQTWKNKENAFSSTVHHKIPAFSPTSSL